MRISGYVCMLLLEYVCVYARGCLCGSQSCVYIRVCFSICQGLCVHVSQGMFVFISGIFVCISGCVYVYYRACLYVSQV